MTDAALLIGAIAALVTAIGGAATAVITALRSSGRQRLAAAEEATRLTAAARDGDRRGSHDSGPRHREGSARHSGRDYESDDLVERLQAALELARAAEDIADTLTGHVGSGHDGSGHGNGPHEGGAPDAG